VIAGDGSIAPGDSAADQGQSAYFHSIWIVWNITQPVSEAQD
jgi:hypothetical protein